MSQSAPNKSLRPRMVTVFVAAFLAGGTGAVAVNRFIDVTRTRAKATVECEPIFVAIRDLPAGNPVTVWDVKLREWPKAMVPQAALRPGSFEGIAWPEGHVARLSLREGQPVLRSHLQATVAELPPAVPQPAVVAAEPAVVAAESAMVAQTAEVAEPVAIPEPVAVAEPEPVMEPVADAVAQAPTIAEEAEHVAETPAATDATTVVMDSQPTPTTPTTPTPTESVTGEGWPSTAETVAGSEAAMRFLVVPERIAIMADELTSPRKPKPPSTPVASVATQPKQPATSTKQAPSTNPTPSTKPVAKQTVTKQPMPRAKYPDQAPATKTRPKGGTPNPTPRVTVQPDPESELADEAARTPVLKSVFPNMAAGLEKIESEMTRFRRDRLGSLFRPADDPEGEPVESDGNEPFGQWLPSLRYR